MKLYVLVREDLCSKSYQAVQAGHAVAQFCIDHRGTWSNGHLIYLKIPSEDKIAELVRDLKEDGYKSISVFKEPDLNDTATAVAVHGPGLSYRLQNYKLL